METVKKVYEQPREEVIELEVRQMLCYSTGGKDSIDDTDNPAPLFDEPNF